jgi:hypothetical protein
MPAHVIYPAVTPALPGSHGVAAHSPGHAQFHGVIFSDDLSMEAASVAGGIVGRASAALQAGCDLVLACNRPEAADELLANLQWEPPAGWAARAAAALQGGGGVAAGRVVQRSRVAGGTRRPGDPARLTLQGRDGAASPSPSSS